MIKELSVYINNPNAGTRGDGAETRAHIIECAGQLIAKNGFAKTTSKSICEMAGVNLASINYYFGSRDGLYIAVLEEVLKYIVAISDIRDIYESNMTPREKAEAYIELYVNGVIENDRWHVHIWVQEMMNPSPLLDNILKRQALPKLNLGQKILAQYLGRSEDDPMLHSYMIAAISPFVLTLWGKHQVVQRFITPDVPLEVLMKAIKEYVFAGLEAFRVK